jgi:hypothetical protein
LAAGLMRHGLWTDLAKNSNKYYITTSMRPLCS